MIANITDYDDSTLLGLADSLAAVLAGLDDDVARIRQMLTMVAEDSERTAAFLWAIVAFAVQQATDIDRRSLGDRLLELRTELVHRGIG